MYLTSWEGMGTANVTCVSGCTCEPKQAISLAPGATVSVFQLVGLTVSGGMMCMVWRCRECLRMATLCVTMVAPDANLPAVLFTFVARMPEVACPSPNLTIRPPCTHNAGFVLRSSANKCQDCSKRCGQQLQACLHCELHCNCTLTSGNCTLF